MRKFPKLCSAALLAAFIPLACTPFNVLHPDGGDAPPEVAEGSVDLPLEGSLDLSSREPSDENSFDGGSDVTIDGASSDFPIEADTRDAGTDAVDAGLRDSADGVVSDAHVLAPPFENLALWLVADRGVSLTGGVISRWADQSGHGMDAVQDDPAGRPVLLPAALSGHSVIRFQGTEGFSLPPGFADLTKGMVVLAVTRTLPRDASDPDPDADIFILFGSTAQQTPFSFFTSTTGLAGTETEFVEYDGHGDSDPFAPLPFSKWQLLESDSHAGAPGQSVTCDIYVDAKLASSGHCQVPARGIRDGNVVGQSILSRTEVAEILVYDASYPDVSLAAEAYLLEKWGLK